MLVRKIIKRYTIVEARTFQVGDTVGQWICLFLIFEQNSHCFYPVNSTMIHVDVSDNTSPQSVRILEVDTALVAHPDNLWPSELPRVDGVLLCYDASNEDSFTRIPELLGRSRVHSSVLTLTICQAGYYGLGHALVILACKSDLHRAVSPSRANAIGKEYDIGLIEVSINTEPGKTKIRNCFVWEIKAIGRDRRKPWALYTREKFLTILH